MTVIKPSSSGSRGEPVRNRVIDAAERLLRDGKAEFSMRDLATEAGVSFATPFNQFGSKAAIMHALSARRIATATRRFAEKPRLDDAGQRVLLAVGTVVELMLEEPHVNRAVMGWLGTPGPTHGEVLAQSTALWTLAIGAGEGLIAQQQGRSHPALARHLAFGFRGVLSFWTAGELPDDELAPNARDVASALLMLRSDRSR
ncbi:TetR/AcrR family transcriptional regulator [Novosphingobium guangzhouense]|uniref:Short-chain dehydrogenase n=1 Tax=Novosphingobium guangzhouense TaxID=1850347 RepID=A0A2K2G3G5_9SPHN|nr:TetR/AcrR family transcriptional regulator [Novosphingobium guangzhouense]PNU05583.1 short-chain dehydrogenase [Novosphingobium guangzhouense]